MPSIKFTATTPTKMFLFLHLDLFRNHAPPHQDCPQWVQCYCLRLWSDRNRQNLYHDRQPRDLWPEVNLLLISVLAIRDIFYYIDKDPEKKYDVVITYVEIYN